MGGGGGEVEGCRNERRYGGIEKGGSKEVQVGKKEDGRETGQQESGVVTNALISGLVRAPREFADRVATDIIAQLVTTALIAHLVTTALTIAHLVTTALTVDHVVTAIITAHLPTTALIAHLLTPALIFLLSLIATTPFPILFSTNYAHLLSTS